ncbi:MAG: dUTP diphosphatase [Anaerovoracaceae bacterium]|jgi:dUTP pyrophosphatase
MTETIRIKYHSDHAPRLCYVDGRSDWIDLHAAEDVVLKKGDFRLIDLGVSVQLPPGYEMLLAPRSSAFRRYGILQTNGIGVIDESYCADDDHLMMPVYATRDAEIAAGDRICQFRIFRHQPALEFEEVETLGNPARGGFGSTGRK